MAKQSVVLRFVLPALAIGCVALMLVGSWFMYQTWTFLNLPPEMEGRKILFTVEPGQPLWTVSTNLSKAGLISDSKRFREYAQVQGKENKIRAGEFNLYTNMTAPQVLETLTTTSGILHKFSVREGLTWWDTADKAQMSKLTNYADFKKAVFDPVLLAKYKIPADNAEGYLFPETYLLTRPKKESGKTLVETMLKEFRKAAGKAWNGKLPSPQEVHKTVILASLVEKETGDASERNRIAGVFVNRLNKGYLLQCDPTIIYGLGETFDGNIRKKHITDKSNPYNSYKHRGLPPGPICSPGLESIKAAINPEKHSYLYFVAKGDGSHYFSKSLKEHNAAVRKYQLRRNKQTYRSYN
ncbi:Aminodeoxychorismate lyase [Maridesulfovibrio hydrothermalis AM13 = DSM 14728]|uniref:Endolytic murein transglycosylase n=1 Tax=Maridesulfovibrio hydrothermalis AM13 = DSM 14728 TaxID=1121451 RepID=L0REZ1_9BACT|nr:Aminodeoxychorismate lyase [Maridesulfovibrio hydrothermalis AM13 = DSM 14728]